MKHCVIVLTLALSSAAASAEPANAPVWGERIEWTEEGPSAREHASVFVFGDRVVVYAGSGYEPQGQPLADAWAFDLATRRWSELAVAGEAPTPGGSKRVAQAPGADEAYLFGGYGAGFTPSNELHRVTIDGDSLVFTAIEQESAPPARALHVFGFDPQTRRFVAALGVSPRAVFDDAWVGELREDGRVAWRQVESGPGARFGSAFGFDSASGELVVLSGQVPPTPEAPMAMTDELWVFTCRGDAPAWRKIEIEAPPPGRRNPTFTFDDRADRLVSWCGTADGRTNVEDLVVVSRGAGDEWSASRWVDANSPPRRSSGFGFADPKSDRVWLGFGNSAQGRYRDWVVLEPAD